MAEFYCFTMQISLCFKKIQEVPLLHTLWYVICKWYLKKEAGSAHCVPADSSLITCDQTATGLEVETLPSVRFEDIQVQ